MKLAASNLKIEKLLLPLPIARPARRTVKAIESMLSFQAKTIVGVRNANKLQIEPPAKRQKLNDDVDDDLPEVVGTTSSSSAVGKRPYDYHVYVDGGCRAA